MTHILAVANKLLEISEFHLSNLKLQKLLYYVYGVNLVLNPDEELSEGPQAWACGPVSPTVYYKFKKYEVSSIKSPVAIILGNGSIEIQNSSKLWNIINVVYETFGNLVEFDLVERTHRLGTPWDKYYEAGRNHITIGKETIREYFEEYVIKRNDST